VYLLNPRKLIFGEGAGHVAHQQKLTAKTRNHTQQADAGIAVFQAHVLID